MTKPSLLLLALPVLLIGFSTTAAFADFANGDFESGTLASWTPDGGLWGDGGNTSGDPSRVAINTSGLDPRTNNILNMVFQGKYAAQVNDYSNAFHWSSMTQTLSLWPSNTVNFAWAAVLNEPQPPDAVHLRTQTPHFSILLTDDTKSLTLYDVAFDVYNPPPLSGGWHLGATAVPGALDNPAYNVAGVWRYCDWQVQSIDTSAYVGDTLTLTVKAFDCSLGGHGGYAYVDGFGEKPPVPNPVPEPSTLLLLTLAIPAISLKLRKR